MTEELHPAIKRLLEKPTTEDEKIQELRRASFTRANLTEAERTVSRGTTLQETALNNLMAAINDGNEDQAVLEKWRLADALAMTGDYDQAIELHPIEEERLRLQALKNAVERDDSDMCDCEPEKAKLNGVDIEIPTTNISRMIFSPKHGEMVGLEVCKCGEMNARPLTGIHATAASIRARPDIEVLKANG